MLLTGYQAAKIVNNGLKEHELPTIPPQMIYTYISKGYIKSVEIEGGKKRVDQVALVVWFNIYVAKKEALASSR